MADLKEYHRQVSDIQKALRERELYHLELEKKNMMRLHRREKRHERLKAKIKTLQGELIQDELESTQRVTLLLAQVEAIKREYEMLEAQTERLRQKKREYELFIASNSPERFDLTRNRSNFERKIDSFASSANQQQFIEKLHIPPMTASANLFPQYLYSNHLTSDKDLFKTSVSQGGKLSSNIIGPSVNFGGVPQGAASAPVNIVSHGVPVANIGGSSHLPQNRIMKREPEAHGAMQNSSTSACNNANWTSQHVNDQQPLRQQYFYSPDHDKQPGLQLLKDQSFNSQHFRYQQSDHQVNKDENIKNQHYREQIRMSVDQQRVFHPLLKEQEYISDPNDIHEKQHQEHYSHNLQQHSTDHYQEELSHSPEAHGRERHTQESRIHFKERAPYGDEPEERYYGTINSERGNSDHRTHYYPHEEKASSGSDEREYHSAGIKAHQVSEQEKFYVPDSRKRDSSPSTSRKQSSNTEYGQNISTLSNTSKEEKGTSDISDKTVERPTTGNVNNDLNTNQTCLGNSIEKATTQEEILNRTPIEDRRHSTTQHKNDYIKDDDVGYELDDMQERREIDRSIVDRDKHCKDLSIQERNQRDYEENASNKFSPSKVAQYECSESDYKPQVSDEEKKQYERVVIKGQEDLEENRPRQVIDNDEEGENRLLDNVLQGTSQLAKTSEPSDETSKIQIPNVISHEVVPVASPTSYSSTQAKSLPPPQTAAKVFHDANDDDDSDFFDRDVPATGQRSYKSILGDVGSASVVTESDSDDIEGQMSAYTLNAQPKKGSSYRPFASSIPSLRPGPPGTDTDSVDSVEAAIQAAMNKPKDSHEPEPKDNLSINEDVEGPPQPQLKKPLTPSDGKLKTIHSENVLKAGGTSGTGQSKKTAQPLRLDSDSESYGLSGGNDNESDDDFDFYG